uniref:Claudin n=1 Tax=Neogobius melanostomus TaxID=47308 RepID=A0A8C6TGS0_9GOBI
MLSAAVQILAFVLALLGLVGVTVATVLPNWKVSVTGWTSLMTPISHMQGLWMDCNFYSSGVFSCTVKNSMLSLPPYLQMTRISMVLSGLVTGFGVCLASLGLKCTQWGGSRRAKAHTAIAAGGCFVLASVLCLVPASWFTNEIITAFLTMDVPENSKYHIRGTQTDCGKAVRIQERAAGQGSAAESASSRTEQAKDSYSLQEYV